MQATAIAHPNIAVVKYWGKRNIDLNLPATPSISVTLDAFHTRTTVKWGAQQDQLFVNDQPQLGAPLLRVSRFLDRIDPDRPPCTVTSTNNFPTAAGLASSASAFAALTLAATKAAGQKQTMTELSVLARQGSGSACRSLWGGWVEWSMGQAEDGHDSHGHPLAPQDHWDIRVVVAMVASGPKPIGSTAGMIHTEETSPLYAGWTASAEGDVTAARAAILRRDLAALGQIMEHSTLKMHATMLSAKPSVRYMTPETLSVLSTVEALRKNGVGAWYTMDAGPNVKVLCEAADANVVAKALQSLVPRVVILGVGGNATIV